jgi:hypothetical protein
MCMVSLTDPGSTRSPTSVPLISGTKKVFWNTRYLEHAEVPIPTWSPSTTDTCAWKKTVKQATTDLEASGRTEQYQIQGVLGTGFECTSGASMSFPHPSSFPGLTS